MHKGPVFAHEQNYICSVKYEVHQGIQYLIEGAVMLSQTQSEEFHYTAALFQAHQALCGILTTLYDFLVTSTAYR